MEDKIRTTEITEKTEQTEKAEAAEKAAASGKPLIFAGTTEGRQMSERLSAAGIEHIVCVATAYGNLVMKPDGFADVRQGRLNVSEMESLMTKEASLSGVPESASTCKASSAAMYLLMSRVSV